MAQGGRRAQGGKNAAARGRQIDIARNGTGPLRPIVRPKRRTSGPLPAPPNCRSHPAGSPAIQRGECPGVSELARMPCPAAQTYLCFLPRSHCPAPARRHLIEASGRSTGMTGSGKPWCPTCPFGRRQHTEAACPGLCPVFATDIDPALSTVVERPEGASINVAFRRAACEHPRPGALRERREARHSERRISAPGITNLAFPSHARSGRGQLGPVRAGTNDGGNGEFGLGQHDRVATRHPTRERFGKRFSGGAKPDCVFGVTESDCVAAPPVFFTFGA